MHRTSALGLTAALLLAWAGAATAQGAASMAPAEARCAEGISPTVRRRVLEPARQAGGSPSAGAGSSPPGPHF